MKMSKKSPKKQTEKERERQEEMDKSPKFGITVTDSEDEIDVDLVICSNHGMDKGKILKNARSKGMLKPIGFSIKNEATPYKHPTTSVSVEDARLIVEELNKMIDYLDSV